VVDLAPLVANVVGSNDDDAVVPLGQGKVTMVDTVHIWVDLDPIDAQ